jgi:dTDP-4-amino-4,6-dideoxygalactose transaminase
LPDNSIATAGIGQQLAFRVKALLYNWLISPRRYWMLRWLPFLHIGETRYHQLEDLDPLDFARRHILRANVASYMKQGPETQIELSGMIDSLADKRIVNLPVACQLPAQQRLLRYPLLVDSAVRDRIYNCLTGSGMGASIMYPGILPAISGLKALLAEQGPFPAAEQFAGRLLTLPAHAGVRRADIQKIAADMRTMCT